ncbi:EAL domain-containing protein [Massilia sp. R798]|uniref:EAL domain-containing protein n=1 Tax=Massilia soli TaxID=2792854 RepID=A0ABS7SPQ3_9BURK|nr:EAL domain-containing protein [Massilia soli]
MAPCSRRKVRPPPFKGCTVTSSPKASLYQHEPDGPGREAIEVLYRIVAAIELSPTVAIHSVDRNGLVRFWNHRCAELFGVSAGEAMGKPLLSLAPRRNAAYFAEVLQSVWDTGSPQAHDWEVGLHDGSTRWMYSAHYPVVRDGEPQQLFCMEVDVTDRVAPNGANGPGPGFQELFALAGDAIVLLQNNVVIDANPAALQLFHCSTKEQLVGRTLPDFAPPTQAEGAPPGEAAQSLADVAGRYEWQYRLPDGSGFWGEVQLTPLMLDHAPMAYATIRDITLRKVSERNLMMAAQVFDNSRDAILVLDRNYKVIAVNRAFSDLMGYASEQIVGKEAPSLRSGVHDEEFYQEIWSYVAVHDHWEGEIWTRRHDGAEFPCWVALTAIRSGSHGLADYIAILSDITDRKRVEEKNRHLAEHDFLTDLPNRVLLLDRLRQALAAARRQHTKVAVMFIDLDRFKAINDGFGHQAGDQVLKETAARLTRCVRGVDTVSRHGGDEFVVVLADIGGVDQAAHVAQTVMQSIIQPVSVSGTELTVSVSIGISIYPSDGGDIDTLTQHADVAMYHAKQDGRNAFRFFSPEMNAHVVQRVQMENNLRQAIANNEFVIEYQPEISCETGQVVGLEALLRWRHPERGMLAPDEFLPVAESSGLIVPIGEWVLQQACEQAARWRDDGHPVCVAVNLSNAQFFHNDLLACVDRALARTGLEARYLDLEITENVIMNADEVTIGAVLALAGRGVQLTIDDFGTGCSNLSFLRQVPLSKLKIDRTLVGEILRDLNDDSIVPAIIAVARGLKLRVIAEGVETEEQLRFLRQHGCDEYQGYYAGKASVNPDLTSPHR